MDNTITILKSNLDANFNLTAEHNLVFDKYNKSYHNLLNKKFNEQRKFPLNELFEVKRHSFFEKESVYMGASLNGKLKFEVLKKGKPEKKYYTLILPKNEKKFSSSYLVWFLSLKEVQNYLSLQTVGSIQPTIPSLALESLLIPEPIGKKNYGKKQNIISVEKSSIRKLIDIYYADYRRNFDEGSYMTASILAGAIAEVILYELLIENDVSRNLLKNKALGSLIRDAQLLKLDEELGFSVTHFAEVQKLRNQAVHAGLAIGNIEKGAEIEKHELKCLDQIIKHFGI